MRHKLPPLNSLRAFEAAARHLSFTKAADELCVTQGAISQQMNMLEKFLGARLFERHHREVRLTAAGARYFRTVQHALEAISHETALLSRQEDDSTLRIKALPALAMRWLVPRLADFKTRNPNITVLVATKNDLADFEREDFDASIEYGDGSWKNLEVELLFPVALVPVCAPRQADGTPPPRRVEDLAQHVLLHSLVRPDLWWQWLAAAGFPNLSIEKGMRFETSGLTYQAALDGLGIAITEAAYVRDDVSSGRLVMPFDTIAEQATAGYYLVYPRHKASLKKFSVFRRWLIQQTRKNQLPGQNVVRSSDNVVPLSRRGRR